MSIQQLILSSPCKSSSSSSSSSDLDYSSDSGHDEYSEHSTPIKNNSELLSLQIDTDDNNRAVTNGLQSNGLLTFSSHPNPYQLAFNFVQKQMFHSTPKLVANRRKPSVNFHSIDDIVNGGKAKDESDDSGCQSNSLTANNASSFEVSQPHVDESEYNENKENDDENKKQTIANSKKIRTTFTDQQKWMLDQYFRQNPYPDPRETEDLSRQLVLPENVIKVWFQNKRSRDKQRKNPSTSTATSEQSKSLSMPFFPANLHGHLAALQAGNFLKMF